MRYCYSFHKMFKMMIDKNMKKKELASRAGISPSCISRLSNNQMISMDALMAICDVLDCKLEEIMEVNQIEEEEE